MTFRETVDRLQNSAATEADSDGLISTWQSEVARLYDEVAEWLKPYIDNNKIELSRQAKTVSEERLGSYQIDQIDIDIGAETIRLDPRAASVIGARGRIDMSHLGSGDPMMLILTGHAEGLQWSIVDPGERRKLTPLNKETFEAVLDKLLAEYGARAEPSN